MKNKKLIVFLIILLSLFVIGLISIMFILLNNRYKISNFKFNHVSNELVMDKKYDESFNKIIIDTDASDVYIKESDEIRLVIYGNKDKTKISTDNNELNIKLDSDKCIGFCFNNKISEVQLYLPKSYEDYIKIDSDYGNVEIENFDNSKIEIKEAAGNVKIGSVKDAIVSNNYGNIVINEVNNYLDITNDYGDIKIDNLFINKNSNIKSDLGNIKIGKTNQIKINASTDLGNIKINNNYSESDVILNIKNDLGDIKINN